MHNLLSESGTTPAKVLIKHYTHSIFWRVGTLNYYSSRLPTWKTYVSWQIMDSSRQKGFKKSQKEQKSWNLSTNIQCLVIVTSGACPRPLTRLSHLHYASFYSYEEDERSWCLLFTIATSRSCMCHGKNKTFPWNHAT